MNTETKRARFATAVMFLTHGLLVATWVSRIPSFQQDLQLSAGFLGTALLGIALGSLVSMPITGGFVGRRGSRPVALRATYAFCTALACLPLAANAAGLSFLLFVYGASAGAMDVSMNSHSITVQRRYPRSVVSSFHALFSLGGMLGAAAGGLFAAYGVSPSVHFAGMAVACAALTATTGHWLISPEHEETAPGAPHFSLPSRSLFALGALAFCFLLCEGAMADWTAIFLRDYADAGPGLAAAGYAVFSAAMSVGRLLGDRLTDALGPVRITRYGALLAGAGLFAAFAIQSAASGLAGFAAAGFGFAAIIPNLFAAAGRRPGLPAGAGIAAVTTTGFFGFLVGPPMIGWLAEFVGLRGALFTLVVLSFLGSALAGSLREEAE